jgi:NAD-dependent deacetylase
MKKICVLTGAGMSAESGLKTFRDSGGLWEGHDVMEVASPEGWNRNPQIVLDFYNARRQQLREVMPNVGHLALVDLENNYNVTIITQNVDNLHERAGSSNVLHLHGRLDEVRPTNDPNKIIVWTDDLNLGDMYEDVQLRPNIVWFGEAVPAIEHALELIQEAEVVIIVGTSMQVYPAAGLVHYAPQNAEIYYIDPNPSINHELSSRNSMKIIAEKASLGVPIIVSELLK